MSNIFQSVKENLEILPQWPLKELGKVSHASQFIIECTGFKPKIGEVCYVSIGEKKIIKTVVIGFQSDKVILMSNKATAGIFPGALVTPTGKYNTFPVGEGLLGRILDGNGDILDNKGPLNNVSRQSILREPLNPLLREMIAKPFDTGIKAINGLITMGVGQRIGLFAGSGVGKSVLLGMITKFAEADVIVVALVGERGREVNEFINHNIATSILNKTVFIVSPADSSPLCRISAAENSSLVAEYYRDKGLNVLLVMDSLTRYAHALREIGLSIGEPPTTKGYPPSVFTKIPYLIERSGNGSANQGSITSIYTVLAEGDDTNDPIVDCARGVLDGHIVLSRKIAESGHFPAIDINQSISRVMSRVVTNEHLENARYLKSLFAKYQENKDFITLGAYQKGSDKLLDEIIENIDKIDNFLRQSQSATATISESINELSILAQIGKNNARKI